MITDVNEDFSLEKYQQKLPFTKKVKMGVNGSNL